jgi:hypothetical protein
MKRRTTISLTIAGLLTMAGMLYAATAIPFAFDGPLGQQGPIGVAAAPADLFISDYCNQPDLPARAFVRKVDCDGTLSVYATLPSDFQNNCYERYMALAPLLSASATPAPFTPRDLFVTDGNKIWNVTPGNATLFAVVPGCGTDHTGITFDHVGTFGYNMIVTCDTGNVWKIDGNGASTFVATAGAELEGPAVVPAAFGPFGGQIWAGDEVNGGVVAISNTGTVTHSVVHFLGVEAVNVIPTTPCLFCSGGAAFQSVTNYATLYEYLPGDFVGLGGNVILTSEGGFGSVLVTFDGTNYNASFFDNIVGGGYEGSTFVDCDVPTPTPTPTATFTPTPTATATFTPTPTATATFTPTPTATATFTPTPTATATATSTPTPTPTPSPTPSVQVSQLTPTGTTCTEFRNGTAETLSSVNYSVKNGVISQVAPGVFFYWVKVTVPAGNNNFTITETITTGNFNTPFALANGGNNVFNSNCTSLPETITQNPTTGTVTVQFNAPTAGTYILSLKYNSGSVKGASAPSPTTTVHYDFNTTGVPGSTSGLDLIKQ